jgi:RNA polymerase sigma-70 factor (ECF subfamily)
MTEFRGTRHYVGKELENLQAMSTMLALNPASALGRRSVSGRVNSDAELALALLSNQPKAAMLTRQRFAPLVSRIVRKALGPDADVEDVEQDVFLGIFSGIQRLRNPESLRTFVLTVTKRTLGRELRRTTARGRLLVPEAGDSPDPAADLPDPAAHHAYGHLCQLLERLRERDRQAFVLRFAAGMEVEEVAQALGVSYPTARRCFTRAMRRVMAWAVRDPFLCDYLDGPRIEVE